MSKKRDPICFLPSGCLRPEAFRQYEEGVLPAALRLEVDAHLALCPLCRNALEGMRLVGNQDVFAQQVDSLNAAVRARAAETRPIPVPTPVPSLIHHRRLRWIAFSAAATLLIGMIFSFYLYQLNRLPYTDVAEGYVAVMPDRPDLFRLPSPRLEMEVWLDSEPIGKHIAMVEDSPQEMPPPAMMEEESLDLAEEQDEPQADMIAEVVESKEAQAVPSTAKGMAVPAGDDAVQKAETTRFVATEQLQLQGTASVASYTSPASVAEAVVVSSELSFDTEYTRTIYTVAEQMPIFPGGKEAMDAWFRTALGMEDYRGADTALIIEAVIDPWGRPRMLKVSEGLDRQTERQVLRAIRRMPDWQPGYQDGEAVAVRMRLRIMVPKEGL